MSRRLRELIGHECDLDEVSASLREFVRSTHAVAFGALEVTCSDEAEHEGAAAFHTQFVDYMLPALKPQLRAAFRTANLGARYEWGSVHVAEHHYATEAAAGGWKLLVVKINAHVSVCEAPDGAQFGPLQRYETQSTACGALHALLRGEDLPAFRELRQLFASDGHDRIAVLLDAARVPPAHRFLFAAIVDARLQAQRAVHDIHDRTPHSPTLYLVVPCVTLNRACVPDTEIVCGYHVVDRRRQGRALKYFGLSDRPERLRVETVFGRLEVTEKSSPQRHREHRDKHQ